VIKSRRLRWAGHMAHMGERRGAYKVLVGKPITKFSLIELILLLILFFTMLKYFSL
jgi:hypothetical protein